jgi:hypothetical protein
MVKDLAAALGKKPLTIIAELLLLGRVSYEADTIDFEMAAEIVRFYGHEPRKVP